MIERLGSGNKGYASRRKVFVCGIAIPAVLSSQQYSLRWKGSGISSKARAKAILIIHSNRPPSRNGRFTASATTPPIDLRRSPSTHPFVIIRPGSQHRHHFTHQHPQPRPPPRSCPSHSLHGNLTLTKRCCRWGRRRSNRRRNRHRAPPPAMARIEPS